MPFEERLAFEAGIAITLYVLDVRQVIEAGVERVGLDLHFRRCAEIIEGDLAVIDADFVEGNR